MVTFWETPYWLSIDFPSPMLWEVGDENQPATSSPLYPQYTKFRRATTNLLSGESDDTKIVLKDSSKPLPIESPYNGFVNLLNVLDPSRPPGKAASPEFERMAAKPDEYDPHSFAVTEYLFTLAKDQGLNLVSIPSDDLFELSQRRDGSDVVLTLPGFTETLNDSDRMRVTRDGTFLRVEPTWKIREQSARLNRKALRKVLDQSLRPEGITLAARAEFAASVPDFTLDIVDAYAQVTDSIRWNFPEMESRELRFYNSLSLAQREEFLSGQKLSYMQLSPPQRLAFQRMISFTSGTSGTVSMPDVTLTRPETIREVPGFIEITDIVTNQVEQAIQFYSKRESSTVVGLAEYNGFPSKQPAFKPGLLGFMRHSMENRTHSVENGIIPSFKKYYLGRQNEYAVEVLFSIQLKRTLSLEDIRYSPKVLRYDELPADFRATAETVRDRMRARRNRP